MSIYNEFLICFYVLVFGLCIGSFLNVLIYRLPEGISLVKPGSHCPLCKNKLTVLDLIPLLSFLFLKGKCRYCKSKISVRYPLIELLTGIIFLVLYLKLSLCIYFFAAAFFMSMLIAVFFIDLEHMIIPDGLVVTSLICGVGLFIANIFYPQNIFKSAPFWDPLIGMVSISSLLFIFILVGLYVFKTENTFGLGDVKLYLPIGLFLGFKLTLLSFFFAVVLGGIFAAYLLFSGKKEKSSEIPFGPYIVVSVFICMMFGNDLLNWYLGMMGIHL
jgi:leader peptidase (prepilin peptidase) / N-methyltransferase